MPRSHKQTNIQTKLNKKLTNIIFRLLYSRREHLNKSCTASINLDDATQAIGALLIAIWKLLIRHATILYVKLSRQLALVDLTYRKVLLQCSERSHNNDYQ
jgi:hypothetical protein